MGTLSKLRPSTYRKYLESFPEEVYNLDPNSHLVRFLDALCDSGVGSLRQELLANRVSTSLAETSGNALDEFYGDLFGLKRLPSEQYNIDGTYHTSFSTNYLLSQEASDIVKEKDALYRSRIWDYITALQAAGTLAGIRRAARAAFGCECYVLESNDFYATNSVSEDEDVAYDSNSDWLIIYPPTWSGVADHARYDCVLIVVAKNSISAQERKYASSAISRILPQDVVAKIISKTQADSLFLFESAQDELFSARVCESSSNWWERVRFVTGAEKWSFECDPSKNFWVEPNVRKAEKCLVSRNSQEFQTDFTFMVDFVDASSEHYGDYNTCQTEIYSVLSSAWGKSAHKAIDALTSSFGKSFAISLDGQTQVIDGMYPIDYLSAVLPQYQEQDVGRRMWSSKEASIDDSDTEWLLLHLPKEVPLNRIQFNAFAKPFKVAVEVMVGEEWQPITYDGEVVTYTCDSWRGDSIAGESIQVCFDFDIVVVSQIRFIFQRTQRQRVVDNGDSTSRLVDMSYSIDIFDLGLFYRCLQISDFVDFSYQDAFGNLVEVQLKEYLPSNVLSDSGDFWLSKPNITSNAVEYLIFDVRDENLNPQLIDFIEIDSILNGANMNIYSAQESESGGHVWYPYSGTFVCRDGRYELEERLCSFVKLEFYNLPSIIYDVACDGIKVKYNLFPNYAYSVEEDIQEPNSVKYINQLLATAKTVSTSTASVSSRYLKTGIEDIYAQLDTGEKLDAKLSSGGVVGYNDLWTVDAYRSEYSLGENTKTEQTLGITSITPSWSFSATPSISKFPTESNHIYDVAEGGHTENIAYVVGIRSVVFGRSASSALYEANGVFFAKTNDDRFTSNSVNMENVGSNGISPISDSLAVYESRDFDTTCLFDSFDFAVSQKEPKENFANPSDMVSEWKSLRDESEYSLQRADMGSSGTVARLARQGGSSTTAEGIISDPMLVRVEGVAKFSCRVYDYGKKGQKSKWFIDCLDGNEVLYSMSYEIERGGWHTLNSTFQIEPAGGWWSNTSPFRCKLDIYAEGGMAKGDSVFVPVLDMLSSGTVGGSARRRVLDNLSNLYVVYYNGISTIEIPRVVTGNHEIWFALQEDLPARTIADGKVDKTSRNFVGAYYLYYGSTSSANPPLDNECDVFNCDVIDIEGSGWHDEGQCSFSKTSGYVAFDWVPNQAIVIGESSNVMGYLWRWENEDSTMRADMHVYQDTLVFDIFDGDFRSSCSCSFLAGMIQNNKLVRILGTYDAQGTASHQNQQDPARLMQLYISDGTSLVGSVLDDMLNIYDLVEYDDGSYRVQHDDETMESIDV